MSIHTHSTSETYFIYCVGQSIPVINAFKAAMAHAGITAKPLLGRYKGNSEFSFISCFSSFSMIAPWLNQEESILCIHSFDARDRPKATLRYLENGKQYDLGRLMPVPRELALREDAYTFDPTSNSYFICRSEGQVSALNELEPAAFAEDS